MPPFLYPVRNNAPLLCPVHHAVQGSAAELDFRIIPAGFNAPLGFESQRLEFLTGFTLNFNSVNNDNLCFIIYCIKDAIVACPDAVSFFLRELFGSIRSWIGSQGKNSFV